MMETAFVEEVAASLVREFLSKKGLHKTSGVMDQELPRTALSISNRNELRKVLHLQPLYKLNKTRENPLKTILEIMTSYFLEETIGLQGSGNPAVPQNKNSQFRGSETTILNSSFSDGNTSLRMVPQTNQTEHYSCEIDEETAGPTFLSQRHRVAKEKGKTGQVLDSSPAEGEKRLQNSREELRTPELSWDTRTAVREKLRTKPGLIVRAMMAGPTASFQEDPLKRRHLKRPSGISNAAQLREEDQAKGSFGVASDGFQETKGPARQSSSFLSLHPDTSPDVGKERSSGMLFRPHASRGDGKANTSLQDGSRPLGRRRSDGAREEVGKSASGRDTETDEKSCRLNGFQRPLGDGSEGKERCETRFSDCRKTPTSISSPGTLGDDALELVDVEDEGPAVELCKILDPSALFVLQVKSKPIDFCLARDLKILLFGSSLGCFSEEWKIQSFPFSDVPELKYGIVQKKGGPCGVLAAVQGCVLRHLIFGDSGRSGGDPRLSLRPSEAHRTECLVLALADILWRAGGGEKATVALCTGTQQFTPAGKYKADGILETILLHVVTKYEDLLSFLQQNIHKFEAGPYGGILLTLSAILSRSIHQVRRDFDVTTNRLIGAHGYCTQELVNLLLTGKAMSNVFNDVIELDSGNGNTTVLKGVSGRSEVGLLSLFEHYDVCQVGCYLKTPKFPIWLVCSESHFSVLFSMRKDLLGDWKTERRFDLYYYDGLANQQEEIRLTVDTSQPYLEDQGNDLIPPLEHCIRTKWKGAVVNWNGIEPIL